MTTEQVLYISVPAFNKHRGSESSVLSYALAQNEDIEARQQTLLHVPDLRESKLNTLTCPKVYIALGKEASFAPASVTGGARLEFVSQVLAAAKKDDRCKLGDACLDEIMRSAEDVDAQQYYVFPDNYRPLTYIGVISADVARTLARSVPCAEEGREADPFSLWEGDYPLQLAYREVQQVLLRIVSSGPFVLRVSQHAVLPGRAPLKTGSVCIPVGVA